MTGPILSLPENDETYILDTDACDTGLSAVLSQVQSGEERVIAYASRTMSAAERKYETTRKELLVVAYGLKQFRQYLLGHHIVIRTDHAALFWLRRTPEPMPQLARWLTLIEQYDYEVAHRPGKRHGNADGLSRKPDRRPLTDEEEDNNEYDCELDELSPRKMRVIQDAEDGVTVSVREILCRQQRDDPELGDVIAMRVADEKPPNKEKLQTHTELTKKMVSRWKDLKIYDGLVYRRKKSPHVGEPDFMQLLLPRSQVDKALQQCHAGTVAEHFGIQKTIDQVRRRFYWSTWKEDTRRFCQRCPECTGYHRGKLAKQGPLQPVLPGAPYERWYIDLTGPHPKSYRGNIWILTCLDRWSKWIETFPLQNKEAETVAKVLVKQVFTRFGAPLSILSDREKEVDGRIINEVCRLFAIEKLRTTLYKPSTNQLKRFHRTMNSVLAKTVAENQRDWDVRLSYVMAAFRATSHDTTGYSQIFLMLGRETRAPPDLAYGLPEEESDENYDRFVEQMREKLVTAYTAVR